MRADGGLNAPLIKGQGAGGWSVVYRVLGVIDVLRICCLLVVAERFYAWYRRPDVTGSMRTRLVNSDSKALRTLPKAAARGDYGVTSPRGAVHGGYCRRPHHDIAVPNNSWCLRTMYSSSVR